MQPGVETQHSEHEVGSLPLDMQSDIIHIQV